MKNIVLWMVITISSLGFSQLDKKVNINSLKDDIDALELQLSIEEFKLLRQKILKLIANEKISLIDGDKKQVMSYRDVFNRARKDLIIFKDGESFDKTDFVESCVESYLKYTNADPKGICNCVIEKAALNFTSGEWISVTGESMMMGGSKVKLGYNLARNKKIQEITVSCLKSFPEISDSFSNIQSTDEYIELAAKRHLEQLKQYSREDYNALSRLVDMKNYSECYVRTIKSELGSDMIKILNDDPEILSKLQKVQFDCTKKNLK
tara:strand:+ start:53519 stop:54313 length:795 start_codon:yes stop_codon:yes gene_type:complete